MGDEYWDFWQLLSYIPIIRVCRDPSSKRVLAILLSYVGTWLSDELCGSQALWLSEYPALVVHMTLTRLIEVASKAGFGGSNQTARGLEAGSEFDDCGW